MKKSGRRGFPLGTPCRVVHIHSLPPFVTRARTRGTASREGVPGRPGASYVPQAREACAPALQNRIRAAISSSARVCLGWPSAGRRSSSSWSCICFGDDDDARVVEEVSVQASPAVRHSSVFERSCAGRVSPSRFGSRRAWSDFSSCECETP